MPGWGGSIPLNGFGGGGGSYLGAAGPGVSGDDWARQMQQRMMQQGQQSGQPVQPVQPTQPRSINPMMGGFSPESQAKLAAAAVRPAPQPQPQPSLQPAPQQPQPQQDMASQYARAAFGQGPPPQPGGSAGIQAGFGVQPPPRIQAFNPDPTQVRANMQQVMERAAAQPREVDPRDSMDNQQQLMQMMRRSRMGGGPRRAIWGQ